ncbi:MAG TPA: hypothetical protein VNA88_11275 [Candidatus Kapabacteria bacterium]|jgi:hypothetical protein|nr:hypothetical protein [Candidatus Kapabacteria bacterium]
MANTSTIETLTAPPLEATGPANEPWLGELESDIAAEQQRAAAANALRLINEPVYTHVTWRVKPGRHAEFIAAWNVLGDLFAKLPQPPIEVTLIRRADDESVFHSIGSWRSLADAQAVSDSAAAIDAVARLSELCSEGEPAVYEVVRRVTPQ